MPAYACMYASVYACIHASVYPLIRASTLETVAENELPSMADTLGYDKSFMGSVTTPKVGQPNLTLLTTLLKSQ